MIVNKKNVDDFFLDVNLDSIEGASLGEELASLDSSQLAKIFNGFFDVTRSWSSEDYYNYMCKTFEELSKETKAKLFQMNRLLKCFEELSIEE